jgi:hypothetical protein
MLQARFTIGHIMQMPEWIKPALIGAGVGAAALALVGFSWGGWMTGGSAESLASTRATAAVAVALTPYCVLKSKSDPNLMGVQQELDKAGSYQRLTIIEKAGWATPIGAENPNHVLARSCLSALEEKS